MINVHPKGCPPLESMKYEGNERAKIIRAEKHVRALN
jgi:hypothetical protein